MVDFYRVDSQEHLQSIREMFMEYSISEVMIDAPLGKHENYHLLVALVVAD